MACPANGRDGLHPGTLRRPARRVRVFDGRPATPFINAEVIELPFRNRIVSGMTPIPTNGGAAAHAAAHVKLETLDGNGLSLAVASREAAEIAIRQVRTGSNVQHCALLTHLRDGLYANGATHYRP